MNAFANLPTDLPIRDDLREAYRALWAWIAKPGARWTGAEKIAIAEESRAARTCKFCAERKEAASPSMAQGAHTTAQDILPDVAVDAVHRLVTDATRLTQSWINETFVGDLTVGHYVELLGVTVLVRSVDKFYDALSMPLEPMPVPTSGEPSGHTPEGAELGVGWVPMIDPKKISQDDADIFAANGAPNVMRAMSYVPDCVRQMQQLSHVQYLPAGQLTTMDAETSRTLSRPQIELVAARVSSINECFY
jgi:hypothetical protein